MITVNKNIKQCNNCSTVLTFEDNDVKVINQGGWEEYVIVCPKCGNRNEVCYINGNWK